MRSIENSIRIAQTQQDQLAADLKQIEKDGTPKLKGRVRMLVLDDLANTEAYLQKLELERQRILAGQVQWQQIQGCMKKL